jgi:hypothetical protein
VRHNIDGPRTERLRPPAAIVAVLKTAWVLLCLALAYAVGATAWNESTQALAAADPQDTHGVLLGLYGGALVMILLGAACVVAISRSR